MFDLKPGVKNIIAINILVFIACIMFQNTRHIDLSEHLALYSYNSYLFKPWQFITHMFMHGSAGSVNFNFGQSLRHILGNMIGVLVFGSMLERIWGTKKFLIFYFLCGIGAAFCHLGVMAYQENVLIHAIQNFNGNPTWAMFNELLMKNKIALFNSDNQEVFKALLTNWADAPTDPTAANTAKSMLNVFLNGNDETFNGMLNIPTVGASGAVFGVLGGAAYLFPNTQIIGMMLPPIKLKYYVVLYAIYEFTTSVHHIAGDNVAHVAHLGGLGVGMLLIFLYNKTNRQSFY
jgi:membrane associated rhomboid family serine protease